MNGSGSLRVEVTGTGDHTALAGIMRLVAQAQTSRSRAQALADRAAFLLTIVAIVSAGVTLAVWSWVGRDASFVIERVVTVLVIACSARARSRRSSRRRHLDGAGCSEWSAGARPPGARGGAPGDCRVLRQDRHADARRVPSRRDYDA